MNCSDSSSSENHILTIDNDLPVQVKFYIDDNIRVRLYGESLETLELENDTYKFAISSPSFNDCNPYDPALCTPVFSTITSDLDTVIILNRDMTATIRISPSDQLRNNLDFWHVELSFK